ncbi:hypothetical protein KI387_027408, partial [Taxus chinensis]
CRRHQENPLAQFVPNFADPRKENTNPSTGQTGLTSSLGSASRGQPKSGSRKSGNEDFSYDTNGSLPPSRSTNNKEEKIRHNKAMRKICTIFYGKYTKRNNNTPSEAEPFLHKGNGIGPGAGPGIAKMKDSLAAKNMKNVEDEGEADIQDGEETIDEFGNVQSLDILEGIAEESDKFDLVHDSDAWADSDTSQNAKNVLLASQKSHKDLPKGFIRLLKFGRKIRGYETVPTDWVSVSTTSEGDDDTE